MAVEATHAKKKKIDLGSLSLFKFYQTTSNSNNSNATLRGKCICKRELEVLFDFMTSLFMFQSMQNAFHSFFNTLAIDELLFHPFWLQYRLLNPCYALAHFLSEKYFVEFLKEDTGYKPESRRSYI